MHRIFPTFLSGKAAVALLLLRLVVGGAFVLHGWAKIQSPDGPTAWMPADMIPPPLQAVAAFSEFVGGWALLVGVFTPLAALALIGTMIGAVHFHMSNGDPFVNPGGRSWELAAVYLAANILFLFVGPGKLSVDSVLFDRKAPSPPPPPPLVK